MRDKQAFEAYVLEKSKIEKKKIALRRKTILTAGMSLCICLIVLMVLPGLLEQAGNSSDRVPEAFPEDIVGSTEDGGGNVANGGSAPQNTIQPTTPTPTKVPARTPERTQGAFLTSIPKYTAPVVAPPEALPLDQAFAQGKTDYAIPDRINEMTEVATIRQICDWVINGNFTAGTQPEKVDCTMTIYYRQDSFTCYLAESGFFKMGEGAWLKTDPAYVTRLMDILEEN